MGTMSVAPSTNWIMFFPKVEPFVVLKGKIIGLAMVRVELEKVIVVNFLEVWLLGATSPYLSLLLWVLLFFSVGHYQV